MSSLKAKKGKSYKNIWGDINRTTPEINKHISKKQIFYRFFFGIDPLKLTK